MARKVIALRGTPIVNEEDFAAEAITPGHLVNFNGSGNLIKHAGAGLNAAKTFALERAERGDDIDVAYAINDTVKVGHFPPGSRVFALVAAAAAAIVKGDFLESAGDGTVRKVATDAATDDTQRVSIVGRALEAVDNSGGGSAVRIRIEIVG